jgi:multiple sugar transport system permease protein
MRDPERRMLWLMAAPFLFGVTLLVFGPLLWTSVMASYEWDLIGSPRFVGAENFRALFEDPAFAISVRNSVLFLGAVVPLKLLGALLLALLLHGRGRMMAAARVAVLVPTVVPDVAYALLWLWILNPVYGPLNATLARFGLPTPAWFSEPVPTRWAVVAMATLQLGEGFLIALVARRHVARELHELAAISGAGPFSTFARVTLPLMAPFLLVIAARDLTLGLQASFAPALLLTDGGPPPHATTSLPFFIYRSGFAYLRFGESAAATMYVVAFVASLLWLTYVLVGRRILALVVAPTPAKTRPST